LDGAALSAACPVNGAPKTAPIATAETAMTIAAGQRRFRVLPDILEPPLVGLSEMRDAVSRTAAMRASG